MTIPEVSEIRVRVNYSETDQMGVVYHARYLVWLDIARTEHLRLSGMSYRELEEAGLRLVVSDVALRYRRPARFDDEVRVRCWVRSVASREVVFGYAVELADGGRLLATARTSLLSLDRSMSLARL
ncbi:MAG TPA: thioesterase family protein, partial [Gemmatimonadales bacterium]|nr:thioesterase family protein [Gemmatimonadales bacterium]